MKIKEIAQLLSERDLPRLKDDYSQTPHDLLRSLGCDALRDGLTSASTPEWCLTYILSQQWESPLDTLTDGLLADGLLTILQLPPAIRSKYLKGLSDDPNEQQPDLALTPCLLVQDKPPKLVG